MQPRLLRTLSWLSHTSAATPGAAGASAPPSGTMPCSRVPRSVTQTTLRVSELHRASPACGGHRGGAMQPWLRITLAWLSHTSATTPGAAGASAAPSGTMPCSRLTRSVTQSTLRLSELQHAAARSKPLWRPSLRSHASSVALHVGMAVPHVSHDTSTCRSIGSTVRHDAKLTGATLSHAGNAEAE